MPQNVYMPYMIISWITEMPYLCIYVESLNNEGNNELRCLHKELRCEK